MIREKFIRRIAAILFILFFLIAYKCTSQIERIKRYSSDPTITTFIPTTPMRFHMANDDTIFVSISADSLDEEYTDIKIFMFMPLSLNVSDYSLEIGLVNGKAIKLIHDLIIPHHNYAEYPLTELELEWLRNTKFDYISFNKEGESNPCVNIKTKDFFCNFLQRL